MSKRIIKPIIPVLVFLVTVVGLSTFTGTDQVNLTEEMEEATLPVISFQKEDVTINKIFGYRGKMNAESIRDTITPLSSDMRLPIMIQTFQNHVEEISYEVRSMDTERLLEETQVSEFRETQGTISTHLQIQNLIEKNREYHLTITLECDGEEIHYYTRIIQTDNSYVDESLGFVMDFHEKTFDEEEISDLATYLEPNSEGDNTTLQKVTIHSRLNQVGWGDFEGEVLEEPVPSIKEISTSYNSIVLNYVIVSNGANGETEFYNVQEYYRVKYSAVSKRLHLLDYERTMNEMFRGSGNYINGSSLLLGIRDMNVSYMTNENARTIAFVQEGDLWSYNGNTNQLSCVFGFRGREGLDDRENNPDHGIRIISMDESGSMNFVVYGYMNRGEHEGYTGVALYYYDSTANTVQEELFIRSDDSYQVLKEKWGDLFYINAQGDFYIIADGSLYCIHLSDRTTELVSDQLTDRDYVVSGNGKYVAMREKEAGNIVTVMNLENGSRRQITGAAGEILKPLGFVESDFVYGVMRSQDMEDLLYKIVIVDEEQKVVKEYEKAGYYISDAYVENSTVFLERVWKNGNIYTKVDGDAIKSHEIEAARSIQIETFATGQKQTQVKLTTKKDFSKNTPQILTPKGVVAKENNTVSLETAPKTGYYYVYVGGEVILCTRDAGKAVSSADDRAGIVLKDNRWYIWRRGMKTGASGKEEISADMSARIKAGESPQTIIPTLMPDAHVLNLTGCTLSQVLYYVSEGNVVFARAEAGQWLIIAGYDERNVNLYNPVTGEYTKKSRQDSEEMFSEMGSVFISYM